MEDLLLVLTVAGIHLVLVVTPGANFLVVSQHALRYSRQVSLATVAGVWSATVVHMALGFLGFSAVLAQSAQLFNILKWLGALYLIYLGIKAFWASKKPKNAAIQPIYEVLSKRDAFRTGLLTCLSNPKSSIYYLALFTSLITPTTPLITKLMMALVMLFITWCWYAFVAVSFSYPRIQALYAGFECGINYLFGTLMIGFGLRILLTSD